VEGATSTSSSATFADLLDPSAASPTFTLGPATTLAVIGDWGQSGGTAPDYLNTDQANNIAQMAAGGAGVALSTGDVGYPSGTQSTYGDLTHTGSNVSAVFGPNYWPVAGGSMPLFVVPGNHGFTTTFTSLWPSTSAATASGGRATNGTYTVNGTTATVPDYWFAINVAGWRVYLLTAAWSNTVTPGGTPFSEDYTRHWAPGTAQRTWLATDLAANPGMPKIAVFHYPLYSAVHQGDIQDTYLTNPPDGSQSVESLLASNGVKLVLNGHSHVYERNNPHNGMVSIISGAGGAALSPVDRRNCPQTYPDTGQPVVAFAWGWSSTGGSSCNGAPKPTSASQVFHTLRITLNGPTASVQAVNSLGQVIDSTTVS